MEKALMYYNKNLELEKHFSDHKAKSEILNNIGSTYFQLNDYDKALQYLKEALKWSLQSTSKNESSYILNNIGYAYYTLNKPIKSEYYLNKSLAICKETDNINGLSNVYINLSKLKTNHYQSEEALSFLRKALGYARQLKKQYVISKIYLQFAVVYKKIKNFNEHQKYLLNCIRLSESNNLFPIALSAYTMLTDLYEKRGDDGEALKFYKKIQNLKDFLNDEKRTRAIEEIKIKMEVEQTEREKAILKQKNIELQYKNEQIVHQKDRLEKTGKKLTELNHTLEIRVQE